MAEYVNIQNYSNRGKLCVSVKCLDQIVSIVTNELVGVQTTKKGTSVFRYFKPVHCEVENNKVDIHISVIISSGVNVNDVCELIQKEVAEALSNMVELVPFNIKVKVAGIE